MRRFPRRAAASFNTRERYSRVLGPNTLRILILLATWKAGARDNEAMTGNGLPGFPQAVRNAATAGGFHLPTAASEATPVSVMEGRLVLTLPSGSGALLAMQKLGDDEQGHLHHIATVENEKATLRGGPWTQRLKVLFDKAGMSMEDIWGWYVVLVVSEDVKQALERTGATGMAFTEVTGPGGQRAEPPPPARSHEDWLRQVDAAREVAWRALGELEAEAIVPIVPGGPAWPGQRQAWRVIHRAGRRLLLVTDGLSDPSPSDDAPSIGFGLELAIETDEPVKDVQGSWALLVLQRVANELAEHERVRKAALTSSLSMEVSGKGMPKSLVTRDGRMGVLLGLERGTCLPPSHMPSGRLITLE